MGQLLTFCVLNAYSLIFFFKLLFL